MILVCYNTHPQYIVCVKMGCPKRYIPCKRPVILSLENIDNSRTKLEYKSGLSVAGFPLRLLRRTAGSNNSQAEMLDQDTFKKV